MPDPLQLQDKVAKPENVRKGLQIADRRFRPIYINGKEVLSNTILSLKLSRFLLMVLLSQVFDHDGFRLPLIRDLLL